MTFRWTDSASHGTAHAPRASGFPTVNWRKVMRMFSRAMLAAALIALPACADNDADDIDADDADAPAPAATETPTPVTPTLLMTIPFEAEGGSKVGGQVQILSNDT